MGGNGKHRWRISFPTKSSSSSKSQPPSDFICPISGSLMFDPVVVSSGQTFERTSVQVCRDLSFVPSLPDGTFPNFDVMIPNLALKSTILSWCNNSNFPAPSVPDYFAIQSIIRLRMLNFRDSERDLLRGVGDKPKVMFSHAATELYPRADRFYSSSSSEESVIVNVPATPLLPFTTRPSCYSNSESESSEIDVTNSNYSLSEETDVIAKLKSADVYDQEQVLISLRKKTRTNEEARVSLCTSKLLNELKSALTSKYSDVQTNAAAIIVNLSLHKGNKVKIVRSGIVPSLIDILKSGLPESQEHAAGALFSLALEDENRTAIGVLGALQPLLHALRSDSERTRNDSALGLYHLSLIQSNRVKLVKLGAVSTLLTLLKRGDLLGRVLLILCNLAMCVEGKSTMLDSNAVECLVDILRNESEFESESTRENCVAVLYSLSSGSLRFKGLAREARAVDVLRVVEEKGSERGREKAKRMLMMLRERGEDEDEEMDWEGVLEGGVSRNRYRVGRKVNGHNSTEF